MKKGKLFAPFLTLFVLALTLGFMLFWNYRLIDILWIMLVEFFFFYVLGSIIAKKVMKFVEKNEEEARELAEKEGSVIEKEAPDANNENSEEAASSVRNGEGEAASAFRTRS